MMLRIEAFRKEHLDQINLDYELSDETKSTFMPNGQVTGVTLFDEDTILCFGGVHLLWKGVGECWIMLSNEGRLKPLTVAKYTIKLFDDIMSKDSLIRMQASVSASDPKAISFAKWLGFEVEGLMRKYGPDGNDYYRLARIR